MWACTLTERGCAWEGETETLRAKGLVWSLDIIHKLTLVPFSDVDTQAWGTGSRILAQSKVRALHGRPARG